MSTIGALASRYLGSGADWIEAASTAGGGGARLGQPFSFGHQLSFDRPPPHNLTDLQWHSSAYLDPGLAWTLPTVPPASTPPASVQVTIVKHQSGQAATVGGARLTNVPAPAHVVITRTTAQSASGLPAGGATGMSVREWPAGYYQTQRAGPVAVPMDVYEEQRNTVQGAARRSAPTIAYGRPVAPTDETPGPGQYEVPQPWASRGPAWTMKGRTVATVEVKTNVPGPGQYEMTASTAAGPAFSMRPRLSRPGDRAAEDEVAPGPGQYEQLSGFGGPAFSMPGKAAARVEELPGPGAYELNIAVSSGPAATMPGRPRQQRSEVLPGPADYQSSVVDTRRDGPAITIGTRPHVAPQRDAPAPGDYDAPPVMGHCGPSFSLGARAAPPHPRDISPGAGAYHVPAAVGAGAPAFSMGERPAPAADEGRPGPAEYFRPLVPGGPAYSLGARAAPAPDAAWLPGPGAYGTLVGAPGGPAFTFAFSDRHEPGGGRDEGDVPGPGAYQEAEVPRGPAFTMAARHASGDEAAGELVPAPGHYGVPSHPGKASLPAFTIGRRPADVVVDGPGPNDYAVPQDVWKDGPSFSMTGRAEAVGQRTNLHPGPGEYSVQPLPRGPAFSLSGRPAPAPHTDGPAPGDYNNDATEAGPAFTMVGRRADAARPVSPGPGAYISTQPPVDGPAFTIAGRAASPPAATSSAVGPWTYDVVVPLPSAPSYTMLGKGWETRALPDSPGPGTYTQDGAAAREGPSWSLGQRTAPAPAPGADTPAVGHYDVPTSFPAGLAYTMGRRPAESAAEVGPGPGDHHIMDVARGPAAPAFTMRGRQGEAVVEPTPGPGNYNQAPDSDRGPAFSMAQRYQEDMPVVDLGVPGPGQYVPPEAERGPAYSMRQRLPADLRDPKAHHPGPGEYSVENVAGGPAFTMRIKAKSHAVGAEAAAIAAEGLPGPAEYGIPTRVGAPSSPAFTIRDKPRAAPDKDIPGPGDYGVPGGSGPAGPAFTLAGLRPGPSGLLLPGPGEYHQAQVEPLGPAHSMARRFKPSRRALRAKKQAPAPGDYHHSLPAPGPSYSMVPPRAPAVRVTPGPGDYHGAVPPASPAWSLQPPPAPAPPNGYPGPGTYHDASRHVFPRPLGSVVSSILKTAVRPDGGASAQRFYLDAADVRRSGERDQAGAAAAGAGGKRVVFTSGTAFRDSQDAAAARRGAPAGGSVATTAAQVARSSRPEKGGAVSHSGLWRG